MTEPRTRLPRNRVMGVMTAISGALIALVLAAKAAGVLPAPALMSPALAIGFCLIATLIVVGLAAWYLTRTDEHDLNANLWAMAWAWIATVTVGSNWTILHGAGLAPPPMLIIILLAGAGVSALVWLWLRFR